jgi:predicted nucleic acid-binding protein
MTVLDTDIVTLLSYGKTEKLQERLAAVAEGEELAVTIITRMEILQGRFASIRNAADPEELRVATERFQASERLLNSFVRLDPNDAAMEHFERLRKGKKTRNIRRGDMLIACITLAHEALLVTRNVKDYRDVAGLRVENWAD